MYLLKLFNSNPGPGFVNPIDDIEYQHRHSTSKSTKQSFIKIDLNYHQIDNFHTWNYWMMGSGNGTINNIKKILINVNEIRYVFYYFEKIFTSKGGVKIMIIISPWPIWQGVVNLSTDPSGRQHPS